MENLMGTKKKRKRKETRTVKVTHLNKISDEALTNLAITLLEYAQMDKKMV